MSETPFRASPPGTASAAPAGTPDGRWTLVMVRDLAHPIDRVWAALTDPGELAAWAPFTAPRSLADPGDVTLRMVDDDDESASVDLPAAVLRSEPPHVLEYTWDADVLRWELEETSTGTRLTLHHTVAGPEMVAMVTAGWHICLDVAERLLAGRPVPPVRGSRAREFGWTELRDAYAERLGVPAVDPGPAP